MKLKVAVILLTVSLLGACHKTTCPTFDEKAGEKSLQGGGKTKSGLYPKSMGK
ncbi:MAG: hypothetical protein SFW35_03375 [Chitinophagales bacterium]|nr:hypothetical protein [Chitinophagales bacterium]